MIGVADVGSNLGGAGVEMKFGFSVKLSFVALLVAGGGVFSRGENFDDSLYEPVLEDFRPVTSDWKLCKNARLEGERLTVEKSRTNGVSLASGVIDVSGLRGHGYEVEVTVDGRLTSRPSDSYRGLKLMMEIERKGAPSLYPQAFVSTNVFARERVSFRCSVNCSSVVRARLYMGLDSVSGRASFDLSTLRIRPLPTFYPDVNGSLKSRYSAAFPSEIRRGVMSPGRDMNEDDFKTLKEWGANLIRYQMGVRPEDKESKISQKSDAEEIADFDAWLGRRLDHLERDLIPMARRYKFKLVVALFGYPGGRERPNHPHFPMFDNEVFARHFVKTWGMIAERFKGNEDVIYGYNTLSEPNHPRLVKYDCWTLQKLAANAIRRKDPVTPVIVESNYGDSPAGFAFLRPLNLADVIYEFHFYNPMTYTHQGVIGFPKGGGYPDTAKKLDRDFLLKELKPVLDFSARHGAKVYCGEFSAVGWAEGADRWLKDTISILNEKGIDWTYHAFREWPPWSVEHEGGWTPSKDNPRKRELLRGLRAGVSSTVTAKVDFSRRIGAVRPLNGLCNSLPLYGMGNPEKRARFAGWMKELAIPYTRYHDAVFANPGLDVIDVSRIFPLFHADADDLRNYNFGPTDDYLAQARESGTELDFRFGEAIEHLPKNYRIKVPEDIGKWADICLHIARHYRPMVKSWSIWEEPNNKHLLLGTNAYPQAYFKMYETLSKKLKAEFPDMPVGGPALMGDDEGVIREFLEFCRATSSPLDFFSYDVYQRQVSVLTGGAAHVRRILDDCGFRRTQLHIAEWHCGPTTWTTSTPQALAEFKKSLVDSYSVAYSAGVLAAAQDAPVDRLYFYDAFLRNWGLYIDGERRPVWYVFRSFADFVRAGTRVKADVDNAAGWYALAARDAKGEGLLMLSACEPKADAVVVDVKGGLKPVEVREISDGKNLTPVDGWTFADGRLKLPQPKSGGVVWVVRFRP